MSTLENNNNTNLNLDITTIDLNNVSKTSKFKSLFELASKTEGFKALEVRKSTSSTLSIEFLNANEDNSKIFSDSSYLVTCCYNDRLGTYTFDNYDPSLDSEIIETLINSAKFGKEYKPSYFTEGGLKYSFVKRYNKDFDNITLETFKNIHTDVFNKVKNISTNLQNFVSSYEVTEESIEVENSLGMRYKDRQYAIVMVFEATVSDGSKTEGDYRYKIEFDDINNIKPVELAREIVRRADKKLAGKGIKSGSYKTILSEECVNILLNYLISHLSAKACYEKTSILDSHIGEEGFLSKSLTVKTDSKSRRNGTKCVDSDGRPVPNNAVLINKGILVTRVYDNEYADKFNVNSNCFSGASFIIKSGKTTFDDEIKKTKKGVYVESLNSLHSSFNPASLQFACPIDAWLIKDGKLDHKIDLALVVGDTISTFQSISKVLDCNDQTTKHNVPKLVIKKMNFVSQN